LLTAAKHILWVQFADAGPADRPALEALGLVNDGCRLIAEAARAGEELRCGATCRERIRQLVARVPELGGRYGESKYPVFRHSDSSRI